MSNFNLTYFIITLILLLILFLIFNKCDINSDFKIPNQILEDTQFHTIIITSAKTNQNIEKLKIKIEKLAENPRISFITQKL